jgi:hypothetical protein
MSRMVLWKRRGSAVHTRGSDGPRNSASLRVPASRASCLSVLREGGRLQGDIAGARFVSPSDARIVQQYRLAA